FMERRDEFIQPGGRQVQHPRDLWPRLKVVSGWADGAADADAAQAATLFNHATFQPKGLLATEGAVTIPWGREPGSVPALTSHFLEFIEAGGTRVLLAHELEIDREYEVLLTNGGGLWRYRLGDVVRVVGWQGRTPRLRFLGRADGVCDLRGEKLNPRFVGDALRELTADFAMLAPANSTAAPYYILFADHPTPGVALRLDKALSLNPHYAHCRLSGQLGPLRVFAIAEDPRAAYLRRCDTLGQRVGTVKSTPLHRAVGWETWFKGKFVEDI
ncbi:MAG: GH3 auxin-responsive promoter family protein, partial [Verrucomicrobiaceae bacterium]